MLQNTEQNPFANASPEQLRKLLVSLMHNPVCFSSEANKTLRNTNIDNSAKQRVSGTTDKS